MGEFPSGQRGQTVNLLSLTSVVRIHLLPPTKKELLHNKSSFFVYPLRKQWHIITRQRVYHHRRCISSAESCIIFRNDDIQHFVLMICNSFEIDDIQGFALISFMKSTIISSKEVVICQRITYFSTPSNLQQK